MSKIIHIKADPPSPINGSTPDMPWVEDEMIEVHRFRMAMSPEQRKEFDDFIEGMSRTFVPNAK